MQEMKREYEYMEGRKARKNFEQTMTAILLRYEFDTNLFDARPMV